MHICILPDNDEYRLQLVFPYNEKTVDHCRSLCQKLTWKKFHFNKASRSWIFNFESFIEVADSFKHPDFVHEKLNISDNVFEEYLHWQDMEKAKKDSIERSKNIELATDLPLFGYQKNGANFVVKNKKVMLNDEMGLGKSLQTIAAFHYLGLRRVLIICPNTLKSNWQIEIRKWLGVKAHIADYSFVDGINIINYERLQKYFDEEDGSIFGDIKNFEWQMVVCDESHYIKERKTKRTKAVLQIVKSVDRVALLSGTPMINRPKELVTQLQAIDKLEEVFGGSWKFLQRYCGAKKTRWGWDFDGASHLTELKNKMSAFCIRRLTSEVLKDLPEERLITTVLDMPNRNKYLTMDMDMSAEITKSKDWTQSIYKSLKGASKEHTASVLMDYKNSPQFKKMTAYVMTKIEKLKQEAALQKVDAAKDIFEELIQNKKKAVVFCVHKNVVEKLSKLYPQSVVVTGDVDAKDRQELINKFQDDPETLFFFATIKTCSEGINLSASSTVIFMEYSWTPIDHVQAKSRITGLRSLGKKGYLDIHFLFLKDTIEEDIAEILVDKSLNFEETFEGRLLTRVLDRFIQKENTDEQIQVS